MAVVKNKSATLRETLGILVGAAALCAPFSMAFAQALPSSTSADGTVSTVDVNPPAGASSGGQSGVQSGGQSGVQSVAGAPQPLPRLNGSSRGANTNAGTGASTMAMPATAQTAPPANVGNVAELQRRIANKELAELRTVYNGSYGASLLLVNDDPTYYVALFERKNFWRVIKTQNQQRAEAIFADFARQTSDLASTEIQSVELAARRAATERLIGMNQDRAAEIEADLAVQQSQQQQVTERQRQAQAQASALASENAKAQAQLADLRQQLEDLQRQANAGLPSLSQQPSRRR